jgi:methylated-DNA-[protein]-cysteine S-methyltransferase
LPARIYKAYYRSEIGIIEISGTDLGICSLQFVDAVRDKSGDVPSPIGKCLTQLEEYFLGKRYDFSLSLLLKGTDFQLKVWRQLQQIPYGKTASYQDIALAMKHPGAVRAVGNANHCNPIAILIPCHRVIGKDGSLTGYAGGVWRKKWLLEQERRVLGEAQ